MADIVIKQIEEGMTGRQVADLLYQNFMALRNAGVNVDELRDDVLNAVHVGSVNMLLNTGFTGDYKDVYLNRDASLGGDSALYSDPLKYWDGDGKVLDSADATSGRSVTIGNLRQSIRMQMIKGERYVLSFKGKGNVVEFVVGGVVMRRTLTMNYERYELVFEADGNGWFAMSGDATICDLQLERGTIATDWHASPWDNDAAVDEFMALKYMRDAIRDGKTSFLGGLVLSSIIMLGNYRDGLMERVNAGISGLYSDDDDVAFWGGGTFEQAIATVLKFKQNPDYKPTDEEWAELANFVVTHGGDAFFRGYIYALGGYFRGKVEIAGGKILLNEDGSGRLADGTMRWDKDGNLWFVNYESEDGVVRRETSVTPDGIEMKYINPDSDERFVSARISNRGITITDAYAGTFEVSVDGIKATYPDGSEKSVSGVYEIGGRTITLKGGIITSIV